MSQEILKMLEENFDKSFDAFKKQLAAIRTGRAHAGLIDHVKVDYYGTPTPISQIASISIPDSRTLFVKPWEKNMMKAVEKAILEANLGLSAVVDGECVRVPVPSLTEERRKEFCKQAKNKAEEAKLAVRNSRRDANESLKKAQKNGDISEDDEKRALKEVQDKTDFAIKTVDDLLSKKEKEIMTV